MFSEPLLLATDNIQSPRQQDAGPSSSCRDQRIRPFYKEWHSVTPPGRRLSPDITSNHSSLRTTVWQ